MLCAPGVPLSVPCIMITDSNDCDSSKALIPRPEINRIFYSTHSFRLKKVTHQISRNVKTGQDCTFRQVLVIIQACALVPGH